MALCLTLHTDFCPPREEGQEHISHEKIIKKKKKRTSRRGKRSLSRATVGTSLVLHTDKSGQTKVSLKCLQAITVEKFLKWNPVCQPFLLLDHYLHTGFVLCVLPVKEKKETQVKFNEG